VAFLMRFSRRMNSGEYIRLEVRETALRRFEDSRRAQSSAPAGFASF
jgi:hypothetical protein